MCYHPGGDLVEDSTNRFHLLTRKQWIIANRIRTRLGGTTNLHHWGHWNSPTCPKCYVAPQDMNLIVRLPKYICTKITLNNPRGRSGFYPLARRNWLGGAKDLPYETTIINWTEYKKNKIIIRAHNGT